MVKHHYTADARTTVTRATVSDFKTGLSKVIIGITFKKFKRLGAAFYQTKPFNMTVIEGVCDSLYQEFWKHSQSIGASPDELSVTTSFTMVWNDVGKLESISDVKMSIYKPEGEITVEDCQINQRSEKVQIDFFYSNIDASSPSVRDSLMKIKNASNADIDIIEHDFTTDEGRSTAKMNKVTRVPAVVINRELPALENPTLNMLNEKVSNALKPEVRLEKPLFNQFRAVQSKVVTEIGKRS